MGKGSKPTIGYWYLIAYHAGLGIGPIDSFLEFRGGDKTAWAGQLSASGTITINAPNLWGGEKDQGGIVGDVDVMFGEPTQVPNPYLLATFGDQTPAWRGLATLVFKGGKFGAMSPYPQPASYKICKILKGWDGDVCWYPEKAAIGFAGVNGGYRVVAMSTNGMTTAGEGTWVDDVTTSAYNYYIAALPDRYVRWSFSDLQYTVDGSTWVTSAADLGSSGGEREGIYFKSALLIAGGLNGFYRSLDRGVSVVHDDYPDFPRANWLAASDQRILMTSHYSALIVFADNPAGPWFDGAAHGLVAANGISMACGNDAFMLGSSLDSLPAIVSTSGGIEVSSETLPSLPGATHIVDIDYGNGTWIAVTDNNLVITKADGESEWTLQAENPTGDRAAQPLKFIGGLFYWMFTTFSLQSADGVTWFSSSLGANPGFLAGGTVFDTRTYASLGINPAHALYYARTHCEIGREPIVNINDGSYRAAADKLHAESFGICTEYDPSAESLIEFEQRICNLIGGSVNRSLVDGQYYLDLARGDYVLEDLPILTDDDILSFAEQPSILDNAINSVSVKYFDPIRKESIVTPPVQALALIDSFGTNHQVNDYPEIPLAELSARVGERDLRTTVTPTRAFDLVTKRTTYGWRPNTYFRLQAPKRGIADMVCILGSKETGTLKSGAIKITAAQDIYNLPDASFVEVEHGVDTRPPQTPVPIVLQRAFEAPYIEVVANLTRADLAVLPEETGYLLAVAADPGTSRDYTMRVAPDGGDYVEANNGDWCPTALVVEAASIDPDEIEFTLASASRLGQVEVGSAVLWDDELCRVDAIDATALTITLGRVCADTVPMAHAASSRLWFYDGEVAFDTTEYTDGETIDVKLLTNTGSQQLAEWLATAMELTFDQRQFRPYPPANVTVAGAWPAPLNVYETFTITLAHRDRVLQADQLVEWSAASIGPEPGVTYLARFYDSGDTLLHTTTPTGADTFDVLFSFTGDVRMELVSVRGGLECWQPVAASFFYSSDPPVPRTFEDGTARTFEDGTPRIF